jgi:hypothetical protein
MKTVNACVMLVAVVVAAVPNTAERKWQTGTWTDVGLKHTASVGDAKRERTPPGFNQAALTEVATYVIETVDRRYELQDMAAIGREGLALHVTVGHPVTFAIEKKTAYIKLDGREYRLLVVKNDRKPTSDF